MTMGDEDQEAVRRRRTRIRLIVVMVVLVLVGVALWAMPVFTYPDNIVHSDTLNEGNDHTTEAQVTLDEGTYEVWMTTSIWSWMYLDTPVVHVNDSYGGRVYVDDIYGGDDRTIEGDDCQHFATFEIEEAGTYNVSVTAGFMDDMGMPGTERVYIVEERPSAYASMQWSGITVIAVGLLGATIVIILMALETSERKKREKPPAQPQARYPPPAYPNYPPQQQPYHGQYPPPQAPPPYPPPQQGPPPQQRPPPY
jgi:hypothetical protein